MTTIAVTGVSGNVGGAAARALEAQGIQVVRLGRSRGAADRHFALQEPLSEGLLDHVDGLIHCAWDVHARSQLAHRANVDGSIALLRLARESGVSPIIFISSMAAFDGCRSDHGKTKLEVEAAAIALGATVIRPGLLYGQDAKGLFGTLEGVIRRSRVVPIVGGGVKLPLLHMADLMELVTKLATGQALSARLLSMAHPERVSFRAVLKAIADGVGQGIAFVPVPAVLAMMGLKLLEGCGLSPRTGSDNLVSLLHQNPNPDIACEVAGIRCRPFNATTLAG